MKKTKQTVTKKSSKVPLCSKCKHTCKQPENIIIVNCPQFEKISND